MLGIGRQRQREILQENTHPQGGDDGRDSRGVAQGLVSQPFDGNAQQRRAEHGQQQGRHERQAQIHSGQKTEKGPHHEHVAVGEIDHGQNPVDHGIAQGDERIDTTQLQGIQHLLQQVDNSFAQRRHLPFYRLIRKAAH